jgi:uncharacterized protein YqjF (DUF2071 family)
MRMSWEHLAFLHWRVSPDWLAARLPRGLEVDCHEGSAWLGVVPFFMTHVRPRGWPGLPTTRNFLELNLRTYVTREGRAGVWFFSLDADSWLSVRGARMGFHLPYFDADMDASVTSDVAYRSERVHAGASPGRFRAVYRPDGGVFRSRPGSLEHWLTERYRLYATRADGTLYRGEIHHRPWPLQSAVAEVRENTLGVLIEAEMGLNPEHVMFARSLDVVAWALHRC